MECRPERGWWRQVGQSERDGASLPACFVAFASVVAERASGMVMDWSGKQWLGESYSQKTLYDKMHPEQDLHAADCPCVSFSLHLPSAVTQSHTQSGAAKLPLPSRSLSIFGDQSNVKKRACNPRARRSLSQQANLCHCSVAPACPSLSNTGPSVTPQLWREDLLSGQTIDVMKTWKSSIRRRLRWAGSRTRDKIIPDVEHPRAQLHGGAGNRSSKHTEPSLA